MKRWWIYVIVIVAAIGVAWLWRARQPEAVIELIQPTIGNLRAYVEEQAVTELPQDYLVAMPIAGRLQPITLREGDTVSKGEVLARMDTNDLQDRVDQARHRVAQLSAQIDEVKDNTLEHNALVEMNAMVESFNHTVEAAEAKVEASDAVQAYTKKELERVRQLHQADAAPIKELRDREIEYQKAWAAYRGDELELKALQTLQAVSHIGPKYVEDFIEKEKFKIHSYEQQRQEAETELRLAERNLERAVIKSEIDGVVLERMQTRRQFLNAGAPLLTLGRMEDLEVIAEVLTQRATRINKGDPVEVFGEAIVNGPLKGEVTRVYPAGFQKVSSLGVEQQRVKVAITLRERPPALQVGYRVQVRIYYDEVTDVLRLPRTALFRNRDDRWQVMVVRDGVTRMQEVELGLMNELSAAVTKGLSKEDQVVARPSKDIQPDMRVAAK